jgi:hypothetical protein
MTPPTVRARILDPFTLAVGITRTKVNWVVDADIAGFFDAVSHEWLMRFVEHRIGDCRINRLIGDCKKPWVARRPGAFLAAGSHRAPRPGPAAPSEPLGPPRLEPALTNGLTAENVPVYDLKANDIRQRPCRNADA